MSHLTLDLILGSAPIVTQPVPGKDEPLAPTGIHMLLGREHVLAALWALKSFYFYAQVQYPLTLHCQGEFADADLHVLQTHFPAARLIPSSKADAVIDPLLAEQKFERLRAARCTDFLLRKVTDYVLFSRSVNILAFDSDVLFFRRPTELLTADGTPLAAHWFQRDCYDSYVISLRRAIAELGIFLMPRLNSGIMFYARDAIDLADYDKLMHHPALAAPHWHREQTLHALAASAHKHARYLPPSYWLTMESSVNPETLTARHYTSPIRALFAEQGVALLMRRGFLQAVGA